MAERLLEFLDLLELWAARFNLVSARSRHEVVDRHLVDSLALVPLIEPAGAVADLGSGAGFPGVPIGVSLPEVSVTLIEPRRHRANFLREAQRRLSLGNVTVDERSGDEDVVRHFDVVTGRAVREDVLIGFADRVLADRGRVLVMTKGTSEAPVPPGYRARRTVDYRVGKDRHRVRELARCFT